MMAADPGRELEFEGRRRADRGVRVMAGRNAGIGRDIDGMRGRRRVELDESDQAAA